MAEAPAPCDLTDYLLVWRAAMSTVAESDTVAGGNPLRQEPDSLVTSLPGRFVAYDLAYLWPSLCPVQAGRDGGDWGGGGSGVRIFFSAGSCVCRQEVVGSRFERSPATEDPHRAARTQ